jgi:hypothetical protein
MLAAKRGSPMIVGVRTPDANRDGSKMPKRTISITG